MTMCSSKVEVGRKVYKTGKNFEELMVRSWLLSTTCWHRRLTDGRGGIQPADSLILLENCNILAEYKSVAKDKVRLKGNIIKRHQYTGLLEFSNLFPCNIGIFVIRFNNDNNKVYWYNVKDICQNKIAVLEPANGHYIPFDNASASLNLGGIFDSRNI